MLSHGNAIVIGNGLKKFRIENVQVAAQNNVWFEMSDLFGDDVDKVKDAYLRQCCSGMGTP